MATSPIRSESAPVTLQAFDPADWLARFKAVGGWWAVDADGHANLGWAIQGYSEEQNDQARALWRVVEYRDDWRAEVSAHVLAGGARHD